MSSSIKPNRRSFLLGAASLAVAPKTALAQWPDPFGMEVSAPAEVEDEAGTDLNLTELDLTVPPSPKSYSGRGRVGMPAPTIGHNDDYHVAEGNIKRLLMRNRTGETLNIVYWRNGEFNTGERDDVEKIIRYFMRDWRDDFEKSISRDTVVFIGKVLSEIGLSEANSDKFPLLLSGTRSKPTNRWLVARSRKRNGGKSQVASNSLHLYGRAADLRFPGISPRKIARLARSLRLGGVGTYSISDFVHLDDGDIRSWGA